MIGVARMSIALQVQDHVRAQLSAESPRSRTVAELPVLIVSRCVRYG
jgi:hypothetical protein